jgi:hypothetical protein
MPDSIIAHIDFGDGIRRAVYEEPGGRRGRAGGGIGRGRLARQIELMIRVGGVITRRPARHCC